MSLEPFHIEPSRLKAHWTTEEIQYVIKRLNEHFESHDDWTDAATDMQLIYCGKTTMQEDNCTHALYASLVVTGGDFYAMAGILIRGFALTKERLIILIGEDDADLSPAYYLID